MSAKWIFYFNSFIINVRFYIFCASPQFILFRLLMLHCMPYKFKLKNENSKTFNGITKWCCMNLDYLPPEKFKHGSLKFLKSFYKF